MRARRDLVDQFMELRERVRHLELSPLGAGGGVADIDWQPLIFDDPDAGDGVTAAYSGLSHDGIVFLRGRISFQSDWAGTVVGRVVPAHEPAQTRALSALTIAASGSGHPTALFIEADGEMKADTFNAGHNVDPSLQPSGSILLDGLQYTIEGEGIIS